MKKLIVILGVLISVAGSQSIAGWKDMEVFSDKAVLFICPATDKACVNQIEVDGKSYMFFAVDYEATEKLAQIIAQYQAFGVTQTPPFKLLAYKYNFAKGPDFPVSGDSDHLAVFGISGI